MGSRTNIAILRYLVAVRGGLSGNEIANRLSIQQSSARQALERLVAAHIVTRTDVGRSAAYEIDRDLAFVSGVLEPLFFAEAQLQNDLIDDLSSACSILGPALRSVVLFGSLARGNRDFRDADLLLIVANSNEKTQLDDAIASAFEPIRRRYALPVSTVVATAADLGSPRFTALVEAVRREGLVLIGPPPDTLRSVRVWRDRRDGMS